MKKTGLILLATLFSFNSFADVEKINDSIYLVNYDFYQIRYNCDKKGFDMFTYKTVRDSGSLPRYKPFHQDLQIPEHCRQKSTGTYKNAKNEPKYDRGHGTHSNIWDHSNDFMKRTNMMTNIVPHQRQLNRRGLWRQLEMVTECYRDQNEIQVFGGNVWGNNEENDYFIESHGVVTPDQLFKIIIFNNKDAYAWVMPNDSSPKKYDGDNYLTSIKNIETLVGYSFDIDESLKDDVKKNTPRIPKGCDIK